MLGFHTSASAEEESPPTTMSQSTEGALPPTSGPVPAAWTTASPDAPPRPVTPPPAPAGAGGPTPPHPAPGTAAYRPPAPGRGVVPLRPLLVGEILDGAVSVMRAFPATVFGVSAIVVVLGQIVSTPLDYLYLRLLADVADNSTSGFDVAMLTLVKPSTLVLLLTQTVLLGGLLVTAASRALLGRTAAPGEVWHLSRPRVPRLLGMSLVVSLTLAGILAAGATPGVLLVLDNQAGGPVILFLGLVGAAVLFLWRGVSWSLAGAALMLEDQPVRAALKRSSLLVRTCWWRVLGVRLAATLVAAIVVGALTAGEQLLLGNRLSPATVNADGTVSGHTVAWASVLIAAAFATAVQVVVTPFVASVTALQYLDQRMRREGLDIQLARRGSTADSPSPIAPAHGGAAA